MEYSSFFNAELVDNKPDRTYNSDDWAEYFATFLGNGIASNPSTTLQVCQGGGMGVLVQAGNAFINGRRYYNSEELWLVLSPANGTYSRIDSVVVELNMQNRIVSTKIITGTPAPTPQAPALQQTSGVYQLLLATIQVNSGCTMIFDTMITDMRSTDSCGYIRGLFGRDGYADLSKQLDELNTALNNLLAIAVTNNYSEPVKFGDITTFNANVEFNGNVSFNNSANTPVINFTGGSNPSIDFNLPISFDGVNVNNLLFGYIQNGTDFNTLKAPGNFATTGNNVTSSCANTPSNFAGVLEVVTIGAVTNPSFVYQTWTDFTGQVFKRSFYAYQNKWSTWVQSTTAITEIGGMNLINAPCVFPDGYTSSTYGFLISKMNLESGKTYTFSMTGYISAPAAESGQVLRAYIYNPGWTQTEILEINEQVETSKQLTFVATESAEYTVTFYPYPNLQPNSNVTVCQYQLQEGRMPTAQQLSVYDIKSIANNNTQLNALGPQICEMAIQNSKLQNQSKMLGQATTELIIQNAGLKNQNKALGSQVAQLSIADAMREQQLKAITQEIIESKLNK